MPEITIYTQDGADCSSNTAEIPAFTVGDAVDDWTLKFVNEAGNFYAPAAVEMRVGHINGLEDGTYNNAFIWTDRAGTESTASITVTAGIPSISFDVNPEGGIVGSNGVFLLRGPQLDGRILSATIIDKGSPFWLGKSDPATYYATLDQEGEDEAIISFTIEPDDAVNYFTTSLGQIDHFFYRNNNTGEFTNAPSTSIIQGIKTSATPGSTLPSITQSQFDNIEGVSDGQTIRVSISGKGSKLSEDYEISFINFASGGGTVSGTVNAAGFFRLCRARLATVVIVDAGSGYNNPNISFPLTGDISTEGHEGLVSFDPVVNIQSATARYQFPFKRAESGNDILGATTLSPYSDGKIEGVEQFDHSLLVVRPRTVATASLAQNGLNWEGTMNPISNYVSERLTLRRSTQLDIQIYGDNRMLFQGQISILDKIA